MEKVCGMTWIGELFFRFQKEPADELSSQHRLNPLSFNKLNSRLNK
jgi:hypothetical protein